MVRKTPMWRRYSTLFGRNIRRDIEDEFKFHIEARVRELVAAGWPPRAAEEEANRLFGDRDSISAECQLIGTRFEQKRRVLAYVADIAADIRFALRTLRKTPGIAAISIVTLALGIGATTAIFSVVNAVLLKPLPYAEPERLVQIAEIVPAEETFDGTAIRRTSMNVDRLDDWRANSTTLSNIALTQRQGRALSTADGTVQLYGELVSPALFAIRGVPPIMGRGLVADDERPDADVVVLAESTWRQYFNSDPAIVERVIELDGRSHTVVGVMPLVFGVEAFWLPLFPASGPGRVPFSNSVAQLAPGVSLEAASAEANGIGLQLRGIEPAPGAAPRFEVVRTLDQLTAAVAPALRVLVVAVAVVLAIVCTNVANLMLARGARRHQEIAIRRSLGAARGRIVRQVLTESVVLAGIAGLVGVVLAFTGVALLKDVSVGYANPRFFPDSTSVLPRIDEVAVDVTVLAFAVGLSVVTSLLFGLLPALRLSKYGEKGHSSATQRSTHAQNTRLGHALATVQLGCAMALLIGAGLLVNSFLRLTGNDTGFDPRGVLSFDLVVPGDTPAQRKLEIAETLVARLESQSRVTSAGFAEIPPLTPGLTNISFEYVPEGRTQAELVEEQRTLTVNERTQSRQVSPGYLRAAGARLLAGNWLDERGNTGPAVLVTRRYAEHYFPGRSAVGATMTSGPNVVTIAGVLDDLHLGGLESEPERAVFVDVRTRFEARRAQTPPPPPGADRTFLTFGGNSIAFAARTTGDPVAIMSDLRSIAGDIDPRLAIDAAVPLETVVSSLTTRPRFYALLLSTFGAVAGFIAVIGVYGVLSYLVNQRTKEIGVRMALGAQRGAVLRLVLRQGAWIVATGVAAGVAAAAMLTRYLEGMLYGLATLDVATYVVVAVVFAAVAMLAVYFPARRATGVDPLEALRYE